MIDEKKLEEFAKYGPGMLDPGDHTEIGRLARLGLWAEQRGIPALRYCEQANTSGLHSVNGTAADALASLKVRGVGV
jgi:hypothetical protein